ncbi:MAG: DUF4299 family protein [Clostridia bacterium]|nr:DUF4299 family protein [Clostridia bacterium]
MAVNIEIPFDPDNMPDLSIAALAAFENLSYGTLDQNYCLQIGVTGDHNVLYSEERIGRGFDLTVEFDHIHISLALPNTPHDIELAYRFTLKLCEYTGTDSFFRDNEEIFIDEAQGLVTLDLQASINAMNKMAGDVISGEKDNMGVFGALYPIFLGRKELELVGGTLQGLEEYLHAVQATDIFYAGPRFYKMKSGDIVGLYFVGENIETVIPTNPLPPFYKMDDVRAYYVHLPDAINVPFEAVINHVRDADFFDFNHIRIKLDAHDIAKLAGESAVDLNTGDPIEVKYWGKPFDNGFDHLHKIHEMRLMTPELSAWSHLAVFLRWSYEKGLLSQALLEALPELPEIIESRTVDLRSIICENPVFGGGLKTMHFSDEALPFVKKFYSFSNNGFPACVDAHAEAVLGSIKYHCAEYQNEAYLFVPYGEAFHEGLAAYIEKAWDEFNSDKQK